MCTPTNDQVIQEVRQHLNAANHWVFEHTPHDKDALWTGPVKTALCNACRALWGACDDLISICATGVGHRDPGEWRYNPSRRLARDRFVTVGPGGPGATADDGEWLYDVTCLQHQDPWPTRQKVLLVAESEFGKQGDVLTDFAKLLVARAQVRVLVCNLSSMPDVAVLAGHINQCHDTQPGDTYLLAAFGDPPHTPRIVYYRIEARQTQGALAPIAEDWYPGYGPPRP